MKFRTEIEPGPSSINISCREPVLMMGSCFTENIGSFLEDHLFNVSVNPFGVTYNPFSIAQNLDALLNREVYTDADLDHFNELHFSFDHYTKFSDPDPVTAREKINKSFLNAKQLLTSHTFLILTFGTAFVFEHKDKKRVVNNCHKIPAREFTRRILTVSEIIDRYHTILSEINDKFPAMKILFTVSPVRHIKDGLIENQRSKATLILAIDEIIRNNSDHCSYFPAYEIMMDDLRDYRFYDKDLVHPGSQAIEYIKEQFISRYLDKESGNVLKEIQPLLNAARHRPLHKDTTAYKKFRDDTVEKYRKLKEKYPFLIWSRFESIELLKGI